MRTEAIIALLLVAAQPPAFEVATVKINNTPQMVMPQGDATAPPPPPPAPRLDPSPTGIIIGNAPLHYCLTWAYGVKYWQVSGPDWINTTRYDIQAKTSAPVETGQLRAMVAALLTERLHLVVRRETKEAKVSALVQVSGASKLTPSAPGTPFSRQVTRLPSGTLRFVFKNAQLSVLEAPLSLPFWPPVLDMSGLKGGFDFTYEQPSPASLEDWPAEIGAALKTQLGLRLEPRKAPVDTIVIERGDKTPVEN